ncbi:MAG: hypothetical protein AB1530_04190 [Candidatus Omnitrophota bacterium]
MRAEKLLVGVGFLACAIAVPQMAYSQNVNATKAQMRQNIREMRQERKEFHNATKAAIQEKRGVIKNDTKAIQAQRKDMIEALKAGNKTQAVQERKELRKEMRERKGDIKNLTQEKKERYREMKEMRKEHREMKKDMMQQMKPKGNMTMPMGKDAPMGKKGMSGKR